MPIQIQAPDGSIAEFPSGTSDDVIRSAMAKYFGAPKGLRFDGVPVEAENGAAPKGPRLQGIPIEQTSGPWTQDLNSQVPALPPGFQLETGGGSSPSVPPPPPGFQLESQPPGIEGNAGIELEKKRALAQARAAMQSMGKQDAPTPDNTDALSKVRTASGGFLEGIPVVGPLIRGGVERAAAATSLGLSEKMSLPGAARIFERGGARQFAVCDRQIIQHLRLRRAK